MTFNPQVHGIQNSQGQVWDEGQGVWRNPDGSVAQISPASPAGSQKPKQAGFPTLLGAAVGLGAAPAVGRKVGELASQATQGVFGTGTPSAPTLLQASRGAQATPQLAQALAPTTATPGAPTLLQASRTGGGQQAGGSLLGTIGGRVVPGVAGAIGAADILGSSIRGEPARGALQGAASGAGIGQAILPGAGAIPGAIIGGLAGLAKSFEGGKHPDQVARDSVRSNLQNTGFLDSDFNVTLADGSKFDLGKDGRSSFMSFDGTKEVAHGFEVDDTNPLVVDTIGFLNPLAKIMTGGDPKLSSDFAGQMVNAAMSNAGSLDEARTNARAFFTQAGVTQEDAFRNIAQLRAQGRITAEDQAAFNNGINQVFGSEFVGDLGVSFAPLEQALQPQPVQRPAGEQIPLGGF